MAHNTTIDYMYEAFVRESNAIEGIHRDPTTAELEEFAAFMASSRMSIFRLEQFVSVYEPSARLRTEPGMNVSVGQHVPPPGGPEIREKLLGILSNIDGGADPWSIHVQYETLHPFMDCNGRSGRALWAWQQGPFKLNLKFLHAFYYQTLQMVR